MGVAAVSVAGAARRGIAAALCNRVRGHGSMCRPVCSADWCRYTEKRGQCGGRGRCHGIRAGCYLTAGGQHWRRRVYAGAHGGRTGCCDRLSRKSSCSGPRSHVPPRGRHPRYRWERVRIPGRRHTRYRPRTGNRVEAVWAPDMAGIDRTGHPTGRARIRAGGVSGPADSALCLRAAAIR